MLKNIAIIGPITLLSLLLVASLGFAFTLYKEVNTNCTLAKNEYKKDCVDSLIEVLNDESKGIKQRNDAIWTLGQIADKRALPVLKSLYSSVPDSREPLDKVISQYELKKAIGWCENGNLTSWLYKGL